MPCWWPRTARRAGPRRTPCVSAAALRCTCTAQPQASLTRERIVTGGGGAFGRRRLAQMESAAAQAAAQAHGFAACSAGHKPHAQVGDGRSGAPLRDCREAQHQGMPQRMCDAWVAAACMSSSAECSAIAGAHVRQGKPVGHFSTVAAHRHNRLFRRFAFVTAAQCCSFARSGCVVLCFAPCDHSQWPQAAACLAQRFLLFSRSPLGPCCRRVRVEAHA